MYTRGSITDQDGAITLSNPWPDEVLEMSIVTGSANQVSSAFIAEMKAWSDGAVWLTIPGGASITGNDTILRLVLPAAEKYRIRRTDANGGIGVVGFALMKSSRAGTDDTVGLTDDELRADPLEVTEASSTSGGQGSKNVTVAGTPEALAASTPCSAVIISARLGNTGQIAIGFAAAVDATVGSEVGAVIQAGESFSIRVSNLALLLIDASVSGEGVSYAYTVD